MAINPMKMCLTPGKTAFLVCDVQTKVAKQIFAIDKMLVNIAKMVVASKVLNIPVLVTEHENVGPTISDVDISGAMGPFIKTQGSMCTPAVREVLSTICSGNRPKAVVLMGMEAHLCIEHTAIDLRNDGIEVHAIADCISSRTEVDRHHAFERLKQIGCFVATSENIIFKLMNDTNHDGLKDILKLIKVPTLHF